MTTAELAHRSECGCGHGLPNADTGYVWRGYPGHSKEISNALANAGFPVVWESNEIVEVRIVPSRALKFTDTLDEAHKKMSREALKTTFREMAKPPSFDTALQEKSMATKHYDSGEMDKVPSRFTEEEIRNNGCRPLHVRGSDKQISTNHRGEPLCFMQHKATEPPWRIENLRNNIYSLLNQLNEMTFQDQPLEMQRRLESRRRAVLAEMAAVDPGMVVKGSTSLVNDRLGRHSHELPNAGGFEFSNLKKDDDEAVLHGTVHIDGHYYRAIFIEVHDVNNEQKPVNDPHNWYGDFVGRFNDESMRTIKVGGFPGHYVLCIYPGGR